jgi:Flp pilus assembly pilin Flp
MLKRFLKDETGLELTEYAVAAALITVAIAAAFVMVGDNISVKINSLANVVK